MAPSVRSGAFSVDWRQVISTWDLECVVVSCRHCNMCLSDEQYIFVSPRFLHDKSGGRSRADGSGIDAGRWHGPVVGGRSEFGGDEFGGYFVGGIEFGREFVVRGRIYEFVVEFFEFLLVVEQFFVGGVGGRGARAPNFQHRTFNIERSGMEPSRHTRATVRSRHLDR